MPKFYKAPIYTEEQIEEMDEKDMHFPFSSKYMVYDSVKRQYIPTEALLIKHGVNLREFLEQVNNYSVNEINNELEYISDQIYAYIDKNSGSNMETLKCIVARGLKLGMSPFRYRTAFEEILWKQARFYMNNDDPSKSTGVDLEQKQWLNKGVLNNEDRHIDPKIKTMLMDLGLCWIGSYDKQFAGILGRQDW